MKEADLPVKCRACGKEVKMNQVKFDEKRKAYVCNTCYLSSNPGRPSPKAELRPIKSEEQNLKELKEGMIKYACGKCKYHFSRKKDKPEKKCPYCGSERIEILSNHAAKIIEDSDRYNF